MASYQLFTIEDRSSLERFLSTYPEMEKEIRDVIRKVLIDARRGVVKGMKGKVGAGYRHSAGDPRDAYKAIKMSVYKHTLGGNISILNKRKASDIRVKVLSGKTRRAGDKRTRSSETERRDSYYGSDRGFILRFLNQGTGQRKTRFGNRGSLKASNWFDTIGPQNMEKAVQEFESTISRKIEERAKKI